MRSLKITTLLAGLAFSISAVAQTPAAPAQSKRVAVLVEITTPNGVTRPMIEAGMDKSQPTYRKIPGLIRKYFTIGDNGNFGGMYLWKDRESAQAWFGDAWKSRVVATYGSEPKVSYFDVPIVLDGMAKGQ